MNILVLNGSPKRQKSDVMHVTGAFLEGMNKAAEQQIEVIHVIDKHIEYCTGCFACMRGCVCIYNDDMPGILNKISACDLLLLSFPLYSYGMPAHLKALIDRTMPLASMTMQKEDGRYRHVCRVDLSHLRFLMICGCGFPNSKNNFEPAVAQFRLLFPGKTRY